MGIVDWSPAVFLKSQKRAADEHFDGQTRERITRDYSLVKHYAGNRENCKSDGYGGEVNSSGGDNLLMLEPSNCTEQD